MQSKASKQQPSIQPVSQPSSVNQAGHITSQSHQPGSVMLAGQGQGQPCSPSPSHSPSPSVLISQTQRKKEKRLLRSQGTKGLDQAGHLSDRRKKQMAMQSDALLDGMVSRAQWAVRKVKGKHGRNND